MKWILSAWAIWMACTSVYGQTIVPATVIELEQGLEETSGLLNVNGRILTHNDSGDGPFIYEIDTLTGQIARTVFVENASPVDWEGICQDSTYLYIGDFGNNNGTRTNLRIYRMLKSEVMTQDTVSADTIAFDYADQTSFNSNPFFTNYDAEAFIAFEDSLYIFSKSWGTQRSNIYPLPKQPGTYTATKTDSIASQGLITGADFIAGSNEVWLVGYGPFDQLLVKVEGFQGGSLANATITRYDFDPPTATQVEGICPLDSTHYYVSAEASNNNDAVLYRFSTPLAVGVTNLQESITIYPNPAQDGIWAKGKVDHMTLFSSQGTLVGAGEQSLSLQGVAAGVYVLKLWGAEGNLLKTEKVVVQ